MPTNTKPPFVPLEAAGSVGSAGRAADSVGSSAGTADRDGETTLVEGSPWRKLMGSDDVEPTERIGALTAPVKLPPPKSAATKPVPPAAPAEVEQAEDVVDDEFTLPHSQRGGQLEEIIRKAKAKREREREQAAAEPQAAIQTSAQSQINEADVETLVPDAPVPPGAASKPVGKGSESNLSNFDLNAPMSGIRPGRKAEETLIGRAGDSTSGSKSASAAPSGSSGGRSGRSASIFDKNEPTPSRSAEVEARYEIREELARGGVGRVCRALDPRIYREVAFKELQSRSLTSDGGLERFIREAQVTGQLEHPGIVPVYDLGWQENGNPYYCMRLLHGRTLREEIEVCLKLPVGSAEHRLAFRKLLGHFVDTCHALAYAHDRNVIHRDLKPANVMIGDFGETLVLDWGMAKVLDLGSSDSISIQAPADALKATLEIDESAAEREDTLAGDSALLRKAAQGKSVEATTPSHSRSRGTRSASVKFDPLAAGTETQMGSIMGTLAYMPPEQVLGNTHEMDARTDIYALGGILYEILTGSPPVPKAPLTERIEIITQGRIKPPRTHNKHAPLALEAICLKALSKAKDDRYATASLLAADVEAYLADERVSAYAEPWHVTLRRFLRRHRTTVWTSVAVAGALAVTTAGWTWWEGERLESVKRTVMAQADKATQALNKGDFRTSGDALKEVTGILAAEPSLQHSPAAQRLADLQHLRTSQIVVQFDKLIARADQFERAGNLTEAERILTEASSLIRSEHLNEQDKIVFKRQQKVQQAIAAEDRAEAEKERLASFRTEVDQARFLGSILRGENWKVELDVARRHASMALSLYDFTGGKPERPAELDVATWESVLDDALEMSLVIAESNLRQIPGSSDEKARTLARETLDDLKRARGLGRQSRVLEQRSAECAKVLGDTLTQAKFDAAAHEITPQSAFDFFLLGDAARKDRRFPEAISFYQQALQKDSKHFWSHQFLAVSYLHEQRPEAAVAHFTACIAQRPKFAWTLAIRGIAYAEMKQFEKALADFQKAQELDPSLMAVPLNRGAVHVIRGKYEEAIADFEESARLNPEHAFPLVNLAEALRKQAEELRKTQGDAIADKRIDRALGALDRAVALAPENAMAFRLRGEMLMGRGKLEAAIKSLRQSSTLPQSERHKAECHQLLAAAHERSGRLDEAIACLREAVRLSPEDSEMHWQLAQLLKRRGEAKEALVEYGRALEKSGEVKPQAISGRDGSVSIGDIYKARSLTAAWLGEYRQAMHDYTRSLELEPAPSVLTRRGWAYLTQAQKLALADFEEALRLNPDDPDSLCGRGFAKVTLGDVAGGTLDAEEAVLKLQGLAAVRGPETWPHLFNAATIYAQAARSTSGSDRESHAKRAVAILEMTRKAATEKYADAFEQTLTADTALDPVRGREEFNLLYRRPNRK